jgi:hypothetical protein
MGKTSVIIYVPSILLSVLAYEATHCLVCISQGYGAEQPRRTAGLSDRGTCGIVSKFANCSVPPFTLCIAFWIYRYSFVLRLSLLRYNTIPLTARDSPRKAFDFAYVLLYLEYQLKSILLGKKFLSLHSYATSLIHTFHSIPSPQRRSRK